MIKGDLLLICYSFPPNPGIGGRRWAKFAKHLATNGYKIHVICNKGDENEISNWQNDVLHENIKVYPVDAFYPKALSFTAKNTLVNKISFKLWYNYFKIYSKGLMFDRTMFWKQKLVALSEEIIKEHNVKNAIVTIPPYRLAKHAIDIKQNNPEINLIVDYRDPWTDNKTFHGFKNLSKKRLDFELKTEKTILNLAGAVISTTEQMKDWANEKLSKEQSNKCIVINNGFDQDEINLNVQLEKNDKTTFLFAGSIYNNLEYLLLPFFEYIKEKEVANQDFESKYEFLFFGSIDGKYNELVKNEKIKSVAFRGKVSREELNRYYLASDFCTMFTVPDHAFNFNTKFFEYIAYRKPIVHFSYDGAVTNFLHENKLGFGVRPDTFQQDLDNLFELIENENLEYNIDFNTEPYEVAHLAREVEKTFMK